MNNVFRNFKDVSFLILILALLGFASFLSFALFDNETNLQMKSHTGYMSVFNQYNQSVDGKTRSENAEIPNAFGAANDKQEESNTFAGNFTVLDEEFLQGDKLKDYNNLSSETKKNIDSLLQRFYHCNNSKNRHDASKICSNIDKINKLAEEIFTKYPFLVMQRKYVFNHPEEMQVGERIQVTFAIGHEMNSIREKFAGAFQSQIPGSVRKGSIITSFEISAELSGKDFKITPLFSQNERFVPIANTSEWSWSIEALHPPGENKLITLKVYAKTNVVDKSKAPIVIETLRARMSVDVSIVEWIYSFLISPLVVISTILGGLSWLIRSIVQHYRSKKISKF